MKLFRFFGGVAINNRQLRYFVKVVEIGTLTGAAEQLHVAQPALGLQIRNLEEGLGVPLLERHSRGVTATQAGQLLYRRAVTILQALENARQEITDFASDERKTVRFGITPSVMALLSPDILIDARKTMPNIYLSLMEELSYILVSSLEEGELDAAFAYKKVTQPGLSVHALLEEDLLAVSSPEVEKTNEPITFYELSQRDLVLAGERDIVRQSIDNTAERLNMPVNIVYETQSVLATKNLVKKGIASAVLPFGTIAKDIKEGTLCGRLIIEPNVPRTLYFLERERSTSFEYETDFHKFSGNILRQLKKRLGSIAHPINSSNFIRLLADD